ncbi:MAG TPA: HupE/UreJ family protein [Opitutaceae bacterium]|nr:HupE/UreJ family protein [Opitutaceae bacterium]
MKASPILRWGGAAALAAACAPLASAHPGHGPLDLGAGLLHPLTGCDHLLAAVGVGLWAGQSPGPARWALPGSFLGGLAAGALAGLAGLAPAGTELWILSSVFVFGFLVAGAIRLPLLAAAAVALAAGFFHGAAHGAEMPAGAASACFMAGMFLTTAALHAGGVLFAARGSLLARWAGAAIAAGGLALALGA